LRDFASEERREDEFASAQIAGDFAAVLHFSGLPV
jgi:hypothetical protein